MKPNAAILRDAAKMPLLRTRPDYDPAFSALSISTLSTVSIFSEVTGPTIL
jgi:hypothetical protein